MERQRESLRLAGEALAKQFDNLEVQRNLDQVENKIYDLRKRGLNVDALAEEKNKILLQQKYDEQAVVDKLALANAQSAKIKDAQARAQQQQNDNSQADLDIAKIRLKVAQQLKQNTIDTADAQKRQAEEQKKALDAIKDRYKYQVIGDLQGGEQAARQRELDDLKRRKQEAIDNKDPGKAKELQDQIDALIESEGLKQVSDSGLIETMIDEVLKNNQAMVDEYRSGKEKAFNALVGQIMKASKGKANPGQVNELLRKKLS